MIEVSCGGRLPLAPGFRRFAPVIRGHTPSLAPIFLLLADIRVAVGTAVVIESLRTMEGRNIVNVGSEMPHLIVIGIQQSINQITSSPFLISHKAPTFSWNLSIVSFVFSTQLKKLYFVRSKSIMLSLSSACSAVPGMGVSTV